MTKHTQDEVKNKIWEEIIKIVISIVFIFVLFCYFRIVELLPKLWAALSPLIE